MPGDAILRATAEKEGQLVEERHEVELQQLPSGNLQELPKEAITVEIIDGKLIKRRAFHTSPCYPGCGHARLAVLQEADIARDTSLRSGFCQVCDRESCVKCLRLFCKRCQEHRDTCAVCGKTCCKKCLVIKHQKKEPRCKPLCKDHAAPSSAKTTAPQPPPVQPPTNGEGTRKPQARQRCNEKRLKKALIPEIVSPVPHPNGGNGQEAASSQGGGRIDCRALILINAAERLPVLIAADCERRRVDVEADESKARSQARIAEVMAVKPKRRRRQKRRSALSDAPVYSPYVSSYTCERITFWDGVGIICTLLAVVTLIGFLLARLMRWIF